MGTTTITELHNDHDLGNVQDGDYFVGERVAGSPGTITFNGVVYDVDFLTNGYMVRTSAGVYANRTFTGTANRLTITNGNGVSGNTTIDISSSYVGQNTITTLGTITTGTWNGSTLNVQYGGNGRATATAYAPICGGTTSTGAHQSMSSGGAAGQLIASAGASSIPIWTTPTYPTSSITSGKILRSDGTNIVGSTATFASTYNSGNILYSSGANNVVGATLVGSIGIGVSNGPSSITLSNRTNIGTPQDYGAIGDGVNDDTNAFQDCLNNHEYVFIPGGTYKLTSSLTVTQRKTICGAGAHSILNFQSMGGANGLVLNYTNATPTNTCRYSDFTIQSSDDSFGHALYIDLSVGAYQFINRTVFDNLDIINDSATNYGFYLYNPTNTDGFFCSQISNCKIKGGIYLARCGDSVTIENNTFYGDNNGIYIPSFVSGAANTIIRENNITAAKTSIKVGDNSLNVRIEDNQIENPFGSGVNYAIEIIGGVGTEAYNVICKGNNINGHSAVVGACIAVSNAYYTYIDNNFYNSAAAASAIYIPNATGVQTKIGAGNIYNSLTVSDSGSVTLYDQKIIGQTVQGDIVYSSSAGALSRLAKNTSATRYLSNTGSSNNPAWAQVDLSSGVTGFLNGVTDASSAAAGKIGQVISNGVLIGGAVSLTSGVAADICSISLTAGDWDVTGNIATAPAAGTTTSTFSGWIHTVSATSPTTPNAGAKFLYQSAVAAGAALCLPVGQIRINVSSTTTVYLSTTTVFAASTMGAYGYINARRAR